MTALISKHLHSWLFIDPSEHHFSTSFKIDPPQCLTVSLINMFCVFAPHSAEFTGIPSSAEGHEEKPVRHPVPGGAEEAREPQDAPAEGSIQRTPSARKHVDDGISEELHGAINPKMTPSLSLMQWTFTRPLGAAEIVSMTL